MSCRRRPFGARRQSVPHDHNAERHGFGFFLRGLLNLGGAGISVSFSELKGGHRAGAEHGGLHYRSSLLCGTGS